jgi:cobalt-zinc-cadmium efflux system outer membrane protein
MTRTILRWSLAVVALACSLAPRGARAQGPTIDAGPAGSPGAGASLLGSAPGEGGGSLANSPGSDAPILGGRAGTAAARVPTSLSNPEGQGAIVKEQGIAAPRPKRLTEQPIYGSLALPADVGGQPRAPSDELLHPPAEVVAEGPPDGLTLDMAIERLITNSLDLRSKFMEIPQAQADVLSAGLRANPIFYADSQLVPYGQYDRSRPGGQTQYDVNISYPLDVTRKRRARVVVASCAKRVLEAQYQDAVRMAIDSLYNAYVDVLAARQTAIYARKSHETLGRILKNTEIKYKAGGDTNSVDFGRVKIQHETSYVGMLDAEETLKQKKRSLGVLLNLPPEVADRIDLRGSIVDAAPPPPPEHEMFQIALAVRPDIVSYRLGLQRAEADVRLAKANRMSDVYLLYQPYTLQNNQPFGLKSPTSWALGVTVPLPVYNRNQGNILRSQLNVTQTRLELETLERQVITEVQLAAKEYESTRRFVARIKKELLPGAQVVMDDTEKLYKGGEKDLIDFLNVQREYNDTVKLYLDTMVRHRRSMLGLNTVLGQRVMP